MVNKRKRLLHEIDADRLQQLELGPGLQARPIRPRPLPYNEKLRVWAWDDPEFERYNPVLAKWTKERVKSGLEQMKKAASTSKAKAQKLPVPEEEIQIPGFDLFEPLQEHSQAVEQQNGFKGEHAYIRHIEKTQEELEDQVEYDLDSEDEGWLEKRRVKGLEDLDSELLERLIDRFEKARHSSAHKQQAQEKQGNRNGSLQEKAPAVLYPASSAIKDFGDEYGSLTVRAAHNYWAQKTANSKAPLLQRFWFDKKWAKQNAVKQRRDVDSDEDESDGIPFQGKEDTRKIARGRPMTAIETQQRLYAARNDLELVRTLADQVKRREKVKKRHLLAWQHEIDTSLRFAKKSKTSPFPASKSLAPKSTAGKATAKGSTGATLQENLYTGKVASSSKPVKGCKKVKFEAPAKRRDQDATELGSPQRSGIVSAVVDQLRKLSGWGAQKPLLEPVALREDQDADGAVSADLGLPNLDGRKGTKSIPARGRQTGLQTKGKIREQASRQHSLLSCDKDDTATPVGFVRAEDSKRCYWIADCSLGKFTLRSMPELQQFLMDNASSRPEWKSLLQQKDESSVAYRQRLRDLFSFAPSASVLAESKEDLVDEHKAEPKKGSPAKKRNAKPVAKRRLKTKSEKNASQELETGIDELSMKPVKHQTRSGAIFSEVLPMDDPHSRLSEGRQGLAMLDTGEQSEQSSSGSDTCIPAATDSSDSNLDVIQSPLRLSRRGPMSPGSCGRRAQRQVTSDGEGESSYSSDSDVASLPPQRRTQAVAKKMRASKAGLNTTQQKRQGIVAAARQRARAARQRA